MPGGRVTALQRGLHGTLRLLHLAIAAAVMPVSALYLGNHYPDYFVNRGGWSIFIVLLGGIFWGLFFIVFTQRYFPFSLGGALLAVGTMLLNGFAGMQLGAFDMFYGAYSVLIAGVAALLVYFTVMTGIFLLPRVRPRFFYYHDWPAYILLPLVMAVVMAFMLQLFWPPLTAEFSEESTWYGRSVYVLFLGADIVLSVRHYFQRNMFVFDPKGEREARDAVLTKWGYPIVLLMCAAIIMSMVLLLARCGAMRRKPGAGKYSDHKITVGDTERSYIRYSPGAEPDTLLLVLHGGGGKANGMIRLAPDLPPLADQHRILLIYPEGQGGHWNDGRYHAGRYHAGRYDAGRADISKADDIAFLRALVSQVIREEKIRRVYAAGMSNGGMMAQRIACEMPDIVQGVVSVAANLTEALAKNCPDGKATAVMFIAGKDDPIVPYHGGPIKVLLKERGMVLSIEDSLAFWSRRFQCTRRADEVMATAVLNRRYDCRAGALRLIAVEDGGHAWPGGTAYLPEAMIGCTTRAFSASQEIVDWVTH